MVCLTIKGDDAKAESQARTDYTDIERRRARPIGAGGTLPREVCPSTSASRSPHVAFFEIPISDHPPFPFPKKI